MSAARCLADPKIGQCEVAAALLAHAAHTGGRTTEGVDVRIAERLLATAAGNWHDWTAGDPVKRSLITLDD